MKSNSTVLYIVLIVLCVLICTYILPWYIIIPICFVLGMMFTLGVVKLFIISLLLPTLLWGTIAAIQDASYAVSISNMVGNLMGSLPSIVIFLLTGLSIGLVCGFSSLSGNLFSQLIVGKNKNSLNV